MTGSLTDVHPTTLADFEIKAKIGQGSYGVVYKAIRKSTGVPYAIKAVNFTELTKKETANVLTEIRILSSIESRHLVAYKEAFFNTKGNELYIVLEYMPGGDLAAKLTECSQRRAFVNEKVIWRFFLQLLIGLRALHRMKVIHRDIKCANIFLSKDMETVKIGDLNIAKVTQEDVAQTTIGTPSYFAPEVWKGAKYSYKSDIFSLGCVLYEMAALKELFQAPTIEILRQRICSNVRPRIPSIYSDDLNDMIQVCLTVNPKRRPSVYELLDHPLVRKWSELSKLDFKEEELLLSRVMGTIQFKQTQGGVRAQIPSQKRYCGKSADLNSLTRYIARKCQDVHKQCETPFLPMKVSVNEGKKSSSARKIKHKRDDSVSITKMFERRKATSAKPKKAEISSKENIQRPKVNNYELKFTRIAGTTQQPAQKSKSTHRKRRL